MKTFLSLIGIFGILATAHAQTNLSFPLWPDGAPGTLGKSTNDIPTLAVFLPAADKATGAAMVICPGGGYGHLADHEGSHYARWLNEQGIAGFVLQYRLGNAGYRHPSMLQDAARALRTVRARAEEWKLDSKRIGIIGSSAGGHLASTLLTHFDKGNATALDPIERVSSRPDLGILCYPVITMGEFTHSGSKKNLLGDNPSPELVSELSNEQHVSFETPPCFIFHTSEDKSVVPRNSLEFASALAKLNIPFELHIYERGPHGVGLGSKVYGGGDRHPWTFECARWLKERGFAK